MTDATPPREMPEIPPSAPPDPATRRSPTHLDRDLLRVADCDAEAFADLYRTVRPQVLTVISRTVHDPAQVEEVAQEVLLEVWLKATHFDPSRGTARAWIMQIAKQRAVDRLRVVYAQRHRDRKLATSDATNTGEDLLERVIQRLSAEQVRAALGQLTESKRQALILAFYHDYSYPAVADIVGVPVGTLKTRVRDGLTVPSKAARSRGSAMASDLQLGLPRVRLTLGLRAARAV